MFTVKGDFATQLAAAQSNNDLIVNLESPQQTIDGFGVAGSRPALTSTYADNLFTLNTSTCIGLTFFLVQIDSDGIAPEGYNSDMYVLSDPVTATARGAKLVVGQWSALPAYKDNASWIGGNLLSAHYADHAARLNTYLTDLQTNHSVTAYACEVQNEPDNGADDASMLMTTAAMTTYVGSNLGPTLAARSPVPRMIMPSTEFWSAGDSYATALLGDVTAHPYVDVVGVHQYQGVTALSTTKRPIWMTEMSSFDAFDASMTNGLTVGGWIHDALTTGGASAWFWWQCTGRGTDNQGLRGKSGDTTDTKRFYVLGQFSRFIRPGWSRVSTSGGPSPAGWRISAYRSPTTGSAVVAVNNSGASQTFGIFYNSPTRRSPTTVTPTQTDASNNLAAQSLIGLSGHRVVVTVPDQTVLTFAGNP